MQREDVALTVVKGSTHTAGKRFETAVPEEVITAAGLLLPRPYPTAWKARDLSSMHETHLTRGFADAAAARGDDLEPGAIQKYCK